MAKIEFKFTLDQQLEAFFNLILINLSKEFRLELAKYIISRDSNTNDNKYLLD